VPPEKSNIPKKMDGGPANEEFELSQATMNEVVQDSEVGSDHEDLEATGTPRKEVDGSVEGPKLNADAVMAGDSTETLCTAGELLTRGLDLPSADEGNKNSGSDDRKSEDMFLNIAKADAGGQELMTRSERRKVSLPLIQPCCDLFWFDLLLISTFTVKNWDISHSFE
jgi:hypothetical protein